MYGFTPNAPATLIVKAAKQLDLPYIRINMADATALAGMSAKYHYDEAYKAMFFRKG